MFEIVDEEGCRSWLSQQDRQTRIWFVARMALRSFPAAIGRAPFDERSTLRLLHHLLIATVGSIDLQAAKKSGKLAFGAVVYSGSAQQIHNDQLFFASPRLIQFKRRSYMEINSHRRVLSGLKSVKTSLAMPFFGPSKSESPNVIWTLEAATGSWHG